MDNWQEVADHFFVSTTDREDVLAVPKTGIDGVWLASQSAHHCSLIAEKWD